MTQNAFDLAAGVPSVSGDLSPTKKPSKVYSKKLTLAVIGVLLAIVMLTFYAMQEIEHKQTEAVEKNKEAEAKQVKTTKSTVPSELTDGRARGASVPVAAAPPAEQATAPVVTGGAVPASLDGKAGEGAAKPVSSGTSSLAVPGAGAGVGLGGGKGKGKVLEVPAPPAGAGGGAMGGGQGQQMSPEQKAAMEREMRLAQARVGGLGVKPWARGGDGRQAVDAGTAKPAGAATYNDASSFAGSGARVASSDHQDEKLAFMKEAASAKYDPYHPYSVRQASGRLELRAGKMIPATLVTAVNSDLPGCVSAVVREAVYDSVNENKMLIPPGASLYGCYDSKVSFGQDRQLLVWKSVNFPDGSELYLAGAPGADQAGAAGMESEVDRHWMRLFGAAFAMSMVTAGVQLSVPAPTVSSNGTAQTTTSAQVVATALAQQFGQLGGQIAGKYLQVAPTLRNFPGERFNIMIGRTILFKSAWNGVGWGR